MGELEEKIPFERVPEHSEDDAATTKTASCDNMSSAPEDLKAELNKGKPIAGGVSFVQKLPKNVRASPATVTASRPREGIAVLGGTGLVGRALAVRLVNHKKYRLAYVVGSEQTAGKPFGRVFRRKEALLAKHYGEDFWEQMQCPEVLEDFPISSFQDLLLSRFDDAAPVRFVVSCIAPRFGWMEDKLLDYGFDVFSISPHARMRPGVPLVVPEVNGPAMRMALTQQRTPDDPHRGRLVKSPNCVSCGVSLALKALQDHYGLAAVSLTTFQTLSGRGDARYDPSKVKGNVYPLHNTVEDTDRKIRGELHRVLGDDFALSVTAQRIYAQRGHFVDVRVKTKRPIESEDEVAKVLSDFAPLGAAANLLEDAPARPIRVVREVGWPRPVQAVAALNSNESFGMPVSVGQLNTDDELFDVTLSLVVDNVARGAYGAALLMAEYFYAMEKGAAPGSTSGAAASKAAAAEGQIVHADA